MSLCRPTTPGHRRSILVGVACLSLILAACSSSPSTSTSKAAGFTALKGKRLPGTSPAWTSIASALSHPADVAGTVPPPVQTISPDLGHVVFFFDFSNSADASAFYENLPLAARLDELGIVAYEPLAGATGIPMPSRGLVEEECQAYGADPLPSGRCSVGTPSPVGVVTIFQRGAVVVMVSTSIVGVATSSKLSKNTALASSALKLLQTVGLD